MQKKKMTPQQRMDFRVVAGLAAGGTNAKLDAAEDPGTALAIVAQSYSDGVVQLPVLAKAVDTVLGLIVDPDDACKLLNRHLTVEDQVELTCVHSDSLSVILQVADRDVVLAALEIDATDANSLAQTMFMLQAWAQNLCLRPDWRILLEEEVGEYILRDLLIAAIWREFGDDEDPTDEEETHSVISPDVWVGIGLDPLDSGERLREMLDDGSLPNVSNLDAEWARRILREKREEFEDATAPAALAAMVQEVDI